MNTDKSREDLASEANRVREQLVETVGQLDHLRRDPLGVGGRVSQMLVRAAAVGSVIVVAGGAALLLLWRRENSIDRLRRDRRRLLSDAWHRPSRLLRAEQPPLAVRLTQALALGVLTSAVKLFSKQLVARVAAPHADPATRTDVRRSRIA